MPDGFLRIRCEALAVLTDVQTCRRFVADFLPTVIVPNLQTLWQHELPVEKNGTRVLLESTKSRVAG